MSERELCPICGSGLWFRANGDRCMHLTDSVDCRRICELRRQLSQKDGELAGLRAVVDKRRSCPDCHTTTRELLRRWGVANKKQCWDRQDEIEVLLGLRWGFSPKEERLRCIVKKLLNTIADEYEDWYAKAAAPRPYSPSPPATEK